MNAARRGAVGVGDLIGHDLPDPVTVTRMVAGTDHRRPASADSESTATVKLVPPAAAVGDRAGDVDVDRLVVGREVGRLDEDVPAATGSGVGASAATRHPHRSGRPQPLVLITVVAQARHRSARAAP